LIIIEGPDGAGKTTLVQKLLDEFPTGLVLGERGTTDRSKLYEVTVPDTFRALTYAVNGDKPARLWDRLFYSEFVYAPLGMPPREPMFNESQRVHITKMIQAIGAPFVLCMPPLQTVLDNMAEEREQMAGVREHIESIYSSYSTLYDDRWFPDRTYVFDYTAPDAEDTVEELMADIQDYIDEYEELQA
jgi:hypothetical protein